LRLCSISLSKQDPLSAKELLDFDFSRSQYAPQNWDREIGIAVAAREQVKRRIPVLRPGMNADVRLGQDCNARYAASGKAMQMDVQEGGACGADNLDQSALYVLNVVEIYGLAKVNY
jgi:hypothetical protein